MLSQTTHHKPNERITARVTPEVYATISDGAKLSGITVNSFLVQVALEQARQLIDAQKMRSIMITDGVEAEWFLEQMQKPFAPNDKLKRALARHQELIAKVNQGE